MTPALANMWHNAFVELRQKNKSVPKVQLVDAVHSVPSLSPGLRIPDIAFPLACPLSSAVPVSLTRSLYLPSGSGGVRIRDRV